jgi:hypothetical protein
MEMNLASIFYLFFRLSPFILVCFFTLGSILNSELKGFVYLVGLCFACFVTFMINGALGENSDESNKSLLCNSFSVNNIYSTKTPASLVILSYTLFYLVYPIAKHDLAIYNVPTLVLFPLLILADIWWNFSHNCFPIVNCIITFIIATGCGIAWAYFIEETKMPGLQYFNIGSNRERCTRPSKQKFKCVTITK